MPHKLHPLHRPVLRRVNAAKRAAGALVVGLLVSAPVALLVSPEYWPLVGWGVTAVAYIGWVWWESWALDAEQTRRLAEQEDPTRATVDLFLLTAAVVSLGAVGFALLRSGSGQGHEQAWVVGLSLVDVVLSWALVHTVFALKYARMYYEGGDGGVEFRGTARPTYGDFAYMAFTIGMTSNVSDTEVEDPDIRRTVLRHALLGYLFGTGVLATGINLVANLSQ